MIREEEYIEALLIVKQYKLENNLLYDIGDIIVLINNEFKGPVKPKLSLKKEYEIINIKPNYRFHDIAIAIKDDSNTLRWYSQKAISNKFDLKEKADTNVVIENES